jgi:hypothetical protein
MEIVSLNAGPKPPVNLAKDLRACADAVDRGEIVDFIGAYIQAGNYCFLYGSTLVDGLVLSTMLQDNCVQRMRK